MSSRTPNLDRFVKGLAPTRRYAGSQAGKTMALIVSVDGSRVVVDWHGVQVNLDYVGPSPTPGARCWLEMRGSRPLYAVPLA